MNILNKIKCLFKHQWKATHTGTNSYGIARRDGSFTTGEAPTRIEKCERCDKKRGYIEINNCKYHQDIEHLISVGCVSVRANLKLIKD